MGVILAESVSIDGGVVAILLAILFVLVAATVACVVAGVMWAKRAARGSSSALVGFLVVVAVEFVLATLGLANSGRFVFMVFGIAFLVHVGVYGYERTQVGGADVATDQDTPPTP